MIAANGSNSWGAPVPSPTTTTSRPYKARPVIAVKAGHVSTPTW